jgi:hypothetical protein
MQVVQWRPNVMKDSQHRTHNKWIIIIPPATKLGGGGILDSACPSVPPSVFCFPDIFWINFSDNEMKLGMLVYNNELQIKFEYRRY